MREPTRGSTRIAAAGIGAPSSSARPSVGKARPSSILIVVVFPDPFGPRKPYTEPRGTARSIWSTATWPPRNRLVRPLLATASADVPRMPVTSTSPGRPRAAAGSLGGWPVLRGGPVEDVRA